MLKIKDNVDLKELEKYGFVKRKSELRRYYYNCPNAVTSISKNRKIENWDDSFFGRALPSDEILLHDLIKDGLVEKVKE